MKISKRTILIIIGTISTLAIIAGVGGITFIYSGLYDISARHPHMQIMRVVLTTTKKWSVINHSRNLKVPELNDAVLIKHGLELYQQHCLACHGAPGENRARLGIGLNPNPPPLEKAAADWTAAEIAWVITNGLKMAGMPAFGIGKEPKDLWALTAFVVRMNSLSPDEYRQMVSSLTKKTDDKIKWTAPDPGRAMIEGSDPEKGKKLLKQYGCVSCHEIPGAPGPQGMTGPSLKAWSQRHYIAGKLVNTPINLIPWLMEPKKIKPGTVMPDLDVTEVDAVHMAGYLYTLGETKQRQSRPKATTK